MSERWLRADAPLVEVDFRAKLVWLVTVSVLATLWRDVRYLAALGLITAAIGVWGGVRASVLRWLVGLSVPFGVWMTVTHGLLNPNLRIGALWVLPGGLVVAQTGLLYGVAVSLRLVVLVLSVPPLVLTSPIDRLVAALARWRVPYRGVFIFATTLRLVPLLVDDAQAMAEAQRLRGIAPEQLPLRERARLYGGMVVPLVLGALLQAQTLDRVLQMRGFGLPQQRTYLHPSRLNGRDWAVLVTGVAVLTAALVASAVWGVGR